MFLTYSVIKKGIINFLFHSAREDLFFGLVDVGYSLPKGQAVKLIFFAP